MRRALLVAALALAGVAAGTGVAAAHANLVRSNPAADARLVRPPTEVRIQLSEPPDARGSAIAVLDERGTRWDSGPVTPSDEPNGLVVALRPLGDGGYVVAWSALSAVDGHETRGSFAFVVGNGPLPTLADVPSASAPPTALEVAGRALGYAGIALGLGTALFGLVVHAAADAAERRRERQLVALAGAAIVVGTIALVVAQGDRLPPRLELLLGLRVVAGLALVATLSPALGATDGRRVALASAVLGALTATLVSHAAALGRPTEEALDLAHVLAVSAWSGGVVAFWWIRLRSASGDPVALARTARRFSILALTSVALLAATGTLQAFARLVLIQDLVETPYGIALLAKIVLLGLVLAVAAFNLLRHGPRGDARALRRATAFETAALGAIFVAAGALTALPPPAQPSGAAFDQTQHVGSERIELIVPAATPGRERFVVRVQRGLAPVSDAEKVALRFTMVEHDMGESELVATERAPGEYVAVGSPTAMYGTWKVRVIVRLPGREDLVSRFTVPVVQQAGQSATAAALTAGAYSLVVFPDPSQPVAGAPIVLSIVALGPGGSPATGLVVTGALRPADAPSAAPERSSATELGAGRYRIDIAALAKGRWTMTLTLGDPSNTAAYSFDVAP